MTPDRETEVAFAIYHTWSRERDPDRARTRFSKLAPQVRADFEAEARAAIKADEAFRRQEELA